MTTRHGVTSMQRTIPNQPFANTAGRSPNKHGPESRTRHLPGKNVVRREWEVVNSTKFFGIVLGGMAIAV